MELEGKTVVITGGSRGMGQRLAVKLGREKANVVVNFKKNATAADDTVKEVLAAGGDAIAVQADIADPEAVGNLVNGTVERFGSVTKVFVSRHAPDRAVLITRYVRLLLSSSSTRCVESRSSRSVNVAPSVTTNWLSRMLGVSIRG